MGSVTLGAGRQGHTAMFTTRNSEKAWIFVPRGWRFNRAKRGIVFCHGAGQDASVGAALGVVAETTGAVISCPDLVGTPGGGNAWANPSQQSRLTEQWNTLKSEFNVYPDKLVVYGLSMGGATALMYARERPTFVQAAYLEVPAINVDDIHDNDRLGQQAFINQAYGGDPFDATVWEASKATRDPYLTMADHAANNIPMLAYYGEIDPVCLPAFTEDFAAAVPSMTLIEQPGLGHDVSGVDPSVRAAFLSHHVQP